MIAALRLGGGLLCLIFSHIAIGSIRAIITREWNWKTFWNGVIKGVIVIVSFVAVWFAGWLNPDLVIVEIDGQTVNLEMAVYMVLLSGFTYYAIMVIKKLKDIVTNKKSDSDNVSESDISEKGDL